MSKDKNWIPYSCPLIDEVIDIINGTEIEDKNRIFELMEQIMTINDDMRWICKDFYNEKEEEKEWRLQAEKERDRLEDRIDDLNTQLERLQE